MGRTQRRRDRDALFGLFAFFAGLGLMSTAQPDLILAGGIAMLGGGGLLSVSL